MQGKDYGYNEPLKPLASRLKHQQSDFAYDTLSASHLNLYARLTKMLILYEPNNIK